MKNLVQLLLVLAVMLAGGAARAATVTITVADNSYSPQTVTIHAGDIVTWSYAGGTNTHPTESDTGAWSTFTINTNSPTKSITFSNVGSFPYHCTVHGGPGTGMHGTITVAAALAVQPAQLTAAAFQLYPNPAHDVVTMALGKQLPNAHTAVQVSNLLGGLVRTIEVRPELTGHELAVNVADLPAGIYAYRLLVDDRVVATQRLALVR